MSDNGNGTFKASWGRIGEKLASKDYPMHEWNKIYREKTTKVRNGYIYKDVTDLFVVEDTNGKPAVSKREKFRADRHSTVKEIITRLQAYANKSIEENYTVTSESVTQKQVDKAQEVLDKIATGSFKQSEIKKFNDILLEFYSIIPRKMKHVKDHLLRSDMDKDSNAKLFKAIIESEQQTLDVMAGQVKLNADVAKKAAGKPDDSGPSVIDIIDAAGLEVEPVTDSKIIEKIKHLMGSKAKMFKHAFAVVNRRTQTVYDKHMATVKDKKVELFWHGSRSENWWSIMEKGLLIRPAGAVHSGSAFGDGVYFASEFDKSLGYTSINSSRWAGGSANNAFLALYNVHVGKQNVVHHSDSGLSFKKIQGLPGGPFDSTWAQKSSSSYIQRDEYIIYQSQQCTIAYLVEVEGSQHS